MITAVSVVPTLPSFITVEDFHCPSACFAVILQVSAFLPPEGSLKSFVGGRLYLIALSFQSLSFVFMSLVVCLLVCSQSPAVYGILHFSFGIRVETEEGCLECLGRVRNVSSLIFSLFSHMTYRSCCLELLS